jgi:uncharacterized protein (DUF1499 family)
VSDGSSKAGQRRLGVWIVGLLLAAPVIVVMAGQLGAFAGSPPAHLGARDGRLAPPSSTPNSVSSQAALHPGHPQAAYAAVDPFPAGDGPATAMRTLQTLIAALPGATIVEARDDYLRAEFRSRWMGYVDDLELVPDASAGVVHVRSASRLGRRDLGVNRARVEALRQRYLATRG